MFGKIKITNFCKRHFDSKFGGTKITSHTPEKIEDYINGMVNTVTGVLSTILDGYAPFCKLVVVENLTTAKVGSLKIDMSNYQYLRHGYSSRTHQELSVLSRWFELPMPAPVANFLVFVVYSRKQLLKEHNANNAKVKKEFQKINKKTKFVNTPFEFINDKSVKWGVVAILGQNSDQEEPMAPITMLRNALGVEEGGSGFPINKEAYDLSVKFWSEHAVVKS